MKKLNLLVIITLLCFFMVACKKEESPTSSEFVNKLTLGTGMSGFNLIGESTSFTLIGTAINLNFRLESQDDMAGSDVQIRIEKSTISGYSFQQTFTFKAAQNYGHIMLSSFSHSFGKGDYKATGVLVTGNKTISSINYTIN